jgi:PIN domain nuclease of toxin-antitoxin system
MRLLLDTHALLWWLSDSPRLSDGARKLISVEANEIYVSAASLWEARIKERLGKLVVPRNLRDHVAKQGFYELSISGDDTDVVENLPMHHRDPFDRMLIAQAIRHSLTIVTVDEQIAHYDVQTVG